MIPLTDSQRILIATLWTAVLAVVFALGWMWGKP